MTHQSEIVDTRRALIPVPTVFSSKCSLSVAMLRDSLLVPGLADASAIHSRLFLPALVLVSCRRRLTFLVNKLLKRYLHEYYATFAFAFMRCIISTMLDTRFSTASGNGGAINGWPVLIVASSAAMRW